MLINAFDLITFHSDLKAFIVWNNTVYTQSLFSSSQINSLISTKMKAVSGEIVYRSSYDRAYLLWDQVVMRHLCKVSWKKPCWSPSLPLCLGAALICRSFPWSLPEPCCNYACHVPCWSLPSDLTFWLDLRPASSLWTYPATTGLWLTLVPSLDLFCSSCWGIP